MAGHIGGRNGERRAIAGPAETADPPRNIPEVRLVLAAFRRD